TSKNLMKDMLPLGDELKEAKLPVKELLKLMCDKKNSVLFTDTECFVLSPDFKLPDESQVLLKVPRKNNMYSVDMKNIVPRESLTCLVAKATHDESMLWHRRLGHVNFKTINKLVKENIVRGKFDGKSDAGFFVGNSLNSDAGKKNDEGVCKESGIDDQERPENSPQDVNTTGPSINTEPDMFSLRDNATLEATHADFFGDEIEVDISNITTTYPVPSTPNTRIHKDHSLDHVIGDVQSGVQTRRMTKTSNEQGFISVVYEGKTHKDLHTCLFACFLSQVEPKKVIQALTDPSWIKAMQDKLLQFKLQKVWTLVDLPYGKRAIRTKWVYRFKKDERCIVIRNKARLAAQGYTQEEGIDYDEVFALVARIEAIRLFLAYASFKDFIVYQMDVKSSFLYGKIEKEVYVYQPLGFEDPEFPYRVYKVEKALYGLHQAPRAWYETYLPIYWTMDFREMSSIGELTFFLGLQVSQKDDGIFISQDKYVDEILKKFGFSTVKTASTLMETSKPLLKDAEAEDVDVHLYRSMIGSLMYLTVSRPDIMFVVCACARFQVTHKVLHLHVVKRIFRYLKG
ncbi:putative ribonuclease H-like domain-containing protein, partial [Tanacetum coccineum]